MVGQDNSSHGNEEADISIISHVHAAIAADRTNIPVVAGGTDICLLLQIKMC